MIIIRFLYLNLIRKEFNLESECFKQGDSVRREDNPLKLGAATCNRELLFVYTVATNTVASSRATGSDDTARGV